MLSRINWYRIVDFQGRACRLEFLGYMVVLSVASVIYRSQILSLSSIATFSMMAILLIPQLAATARRLHDFGLSGWWQCFIYTFFLIPAPESYSLEGGLMSFGFISLCAAFVYVNLLLVFMLFLILRPGNRHGDRFEPSRIDTSVFGSTGHPV